MRWDPSGLPSKTVSYTSVCPDGRISSKAIQHADYFSCRTLTSYCALMLERHCCPAKTPVQRRFLSEQRRSQEGFQLRDLLSVWMEALKADVVLLGRRKKYRTDLNMWGELLKSHFLRKNKPYPKKTVVFSSVSVFTVVPRCKMKPVFVFFSIMLCADRLVQQTMTMQMCVWAAPGETSWRVS